MPEAPLGEQRVVLTVPASFDAAARDLTPHEVPGRLDLDAYPGLHGLAGERVDRFDPQREPPHGAGEAAELGDVRDHGCPRSR